MDGTMKDNESKFELIEKYFDGRLNPAEKEAFDQLMANNQEFAHDVNDYRKLTAFTDFLDEEILLKDIDLNISSKKTNSNTHQLVANAPADQKSQRVIAKPVFLPHRISNRYAAAVVLIFVSMVAASLMFSSLDLDQKSGGKNSKVLTVEYERKDSKPSSVPQKNKVVAEEKKIEVAEKKEIDFLAANFEANTTLEKLIIEQTSDVKRSAPQTSLKLEITQPEKTLTISNEMLIQWKSNDESLENITVKVYDNKNKVKKTYTFPNKSGKTTLNTASLKLGLYYWKVISTETEEVLFIGKFTKNK